MAAVCGREKNVLSVSLLLHLQKRCPSFRRKHLPNQTLASVGIVARALLLRKQPAVRVYAKKLTLFLMSGVKKIMRRPPRLPIYKDGPGIEKKQEAMLLKCFCLDTNATQAAALAKVSRPTANRWYRHYREAIYHSLRRAPQFSGEVEIDIGFFGGRSKKKDSAMVRRLAGLPAASIIAKRPELSKIARRKVMVLGILRRGGDIYLLPIKRKDRVTMEATVRLVVAQGSTIYSDKEPALSKLKLDGYRHESVNHSLEYARAGGIHINGIESFWREARRRMGKNFRGIPRHMLLLHIKESEFRYNHKDMRGVLRKLL